MRSFLVCLTLFITALAGAQSSIPRDTSFTVYSAFQKEVKKYPFIRIAEPVLPKGVSYKTNVVFSSPGRDLLLDVFYPQKKSRKGYPGIVLIFGGGWKSGDKSQSVPMAQQLAARGYVAAAVEYRLSLEAQYPAAVHDIKAAIRWMRANATMFNLDTTKIATHGVSAGGQLAALVGTTNQDRVLEGNGGNPQHSSDVQAIIDIDGVLAFKHPESAEGKVAAEWLGGTWEEKPGIWTEASALTHAGRNTPPVLFINSSLPRFHAGRDDMISKLKVYDIYTEVHTIPDTPHPFWLFHPWFEPTVKWTVKFLDKVFKNEK
ncbi:alpha/beta hydrolase [Segetibacter sp. 3557_3]|uniref:alpha/beta hydrolase n=1 Tax=Segetibacter sp. 3557_3 TaxID=2547429 RepID=UPI001058822D|nr:alpha/beta hydrolase [Segetibacter sp. 3557_3]TDH27771.1 alpha/beta hydrolase [Segetibacter sp. 3557_3]